MIVAAAVAVWASMMSHAPRVAAASTMSPRIINGNGVSVTRFAERWPFVVAVVSTGSSPIDGQFCGGSLLSAQYVLTAAHCVVREPGVWATPGSMRVMYGTRTLEGSTTVAVSQVFAHPRYFEDRLGGHQYDVAVLRLAQPIAGTPPTVRMVTPGVDDALWGAGQGAASAWVAGWGNTSTTSYVFPNVLRDVEVPIIADRDCAAGPIGGYGIAFHRSTQMCAGVLDDPATGEVDGRDSCQGDSGGPLVVLDAQGAPIQVGVVSWGMACAAQNFGVYSRLATLRSWVDSIPGATDGQPVSGGPSGLIAPAGLTGAASGYHAVKLSWGAVTGAERYGIYQRRLGPTADGSDELVQIVTGTNATVSGLSFARSAASYRWVVRALDSSGSAGDEASIMQAPVVDSTPPTRPGPARVAWRSGRVLVLTWGASSDSGSGIASYRMYWRKAGTSAWRVRMPGSRPTYRFAVQPGVRYQVQIQAFDRARNASARSAIRTVML